MIDLLKPFPKDATQIDLFDTGLARIPDLTYFKKLQYLGLGSNKIRKIEGLEKLKTLGELVLSNNLLSSLDGIQDCPGLWKLIADNNKIKTLNFARLSPQLEILIVTSNCVTKLLNEGNVLSSLRIFSLTGNPLKHLEGLELLPGLNHLAIEGQALRTMSQGTYEFIKKKQQIDAGGGAPFSFFTAHTTKRQLIDSFIERAKIKPV